jgi:hypothetical protein
MQYVRAHRGRSGEVDLSKSFFESPKKARVWSGTFLGRGRPAARN